MRHPKARTESDYMQFSKISNICFSEFLRNDKLYHDKNCYLRTYKRYAEAVGAGNMLVLYYEEMRSDPAATARRCFEFLGVSQEPAIDVGTAHGQSAEHRVFAPGLGALKRVANFIPILAYTSRFPLSVCWSHSYPRRDKVERPIWSDADYAWFREEFEARSGEFLSAMGRPGRLLDLVRQQSETETETCEI